MKNYVIINMETNGFNTLDGDEQIIKIDARKIDKDFNEVDSFSKYVKPREKLPTVVEQLIEITNEVLEQYGKDEKPVVEEFLKFMEDSILISSNAKFEMSFLLKAIYKNKIVDNEIYYFDLLQEFTSLGLKKRSIPRVKEYYKIYTDDYLTSMVEILKKILVEYKCSDLEEYVTKKKKNRIRFPGLVSRNVRSWVRFSKGNTKDNRRLIEFIDESKDGKVGFLINYNGINKKIMNLDELIEFKKMGSKTIDDIFYLDPSIMSYMDYYKIDSDIKIEKDDTWLIERLEKVTTDYLKNKKVKVICYGTIDELKKNYNIIDKKVLDKIISCVIAEI